MQKCARCESEGKHKIGNNHYCRTHALEVMGEDLAKLQAEYDDPKTSYSRKRWLWFQNILPLSQLRDNFARTVEA